MGSDVTSVGTYWDPLVWDQARGAYISDLDTDPECPDAFIEWLHHNLLAHARRGGAARAELDIQVPARRRDSQGISRTYPLRTDVLGAMDQAIIEDRVTFGRVLGRSGFIHEAMVAAIAQARRRRGTPLPTPPSRLPTKPPRRDARASRTRAPGA